MDPGLVVTKCASTPFVIVLFCFFLPRRVDYIHKRNYFTLLVVRLSYRITLRSVVHFQRPPWFEYSFALFVEDDKWVSFFTMTTRRTIAVMAVENSFETPFISLAFNRPHRRVAIRGVGLWFLSPETLVTLRLARHWRHHCKHDSVVTDGLASVARSPLTWKVYDAPFTA